MRGGINPYPLTFKILDWCSFRHGGGTDPNPRGGASGDAGSYVDCQVSKRRQAEQTCHDSRDEDISLSALTMQQDRMSPQDRERNLNGRVREGGGQSVRRRLGLLFCPIIEGLDPVLQLRILPSVWWNTSAMEPSRRDFYSNFCLKARTRRTGSCGLVFCAPAELCCRLVDVLSGNEVKARDAPVLRCLRASKLAPSPFGAGSRCGRMENDLVPSYAYSQRTKEKIHILSDLQEISRNVDTMALSPPMGCPPLDRLQKLLEDPNANLQELFEVGDAAGVYFGTSRVLTNRHRGTLDKN
eukprot:748704-Hanusia_phi.AAC.1